MIVPHKHSAQIRAWRLYVDGASRGNPGPASVGCVIVTDTAIVARVGYYVGTATNNYAEYAALIVGLTHIQSLIQVGDVVHILADSQLLVRQVIGVYRVRNAQLQVLHDRVKNLLQGLVYTIEHIPRGDNTQADACANQALDRRLPLPNDLGYLYVA
jgi:ribonuclease HI